MAMTEILVVLGALVAQEGTIPLRPAPSSALALDVAEAVGATVQKVALALDESISAMEGQALQAALLGTGLFELVEEAQASAVIDVRRIDANALLVTITDRAGKRLWVGRGNWPAQDHSQTDPEDAGPDAQTDEVRLEKVLAYRRHRLTVRPTAPTYLPTTPIGSGVGWAFNTSFDRAHGWRTGLGGVAPVLKGEDWEIVRGAAELISEEELALMVGDTALGSQIQQRGFWPRVLSGAGFGAGAVAGLGSGIWLYNQGRKQRSLGISLVTLGIASAAIAVVFPVAGHGHALTPTRAQEMCDQHNAQRRQELKLEPEDLVRFAGVD